MCQKSGRNAYVTSSGARQVFFTRAGGWAGKTNVAAFQCNLLKMLSNHRLTSAMEVGEGGLSTQSVGNLSV
jgi:hypothetical protein